MLAVSTKPKFLNLTMLAFSSWLSFSLNSCKTTQDSNKDYNYWVGDWETESFKELFPKLKLFCYVCSVSFEFIGEYNPIFECFHDEEIKFFAGECNLGNCSLAVEPERVYDAFEILQKIQIEFGEFIHLYPLDLESPEMVAGSSSD